MFMYEWTAIIMGLPPPFFIEGTLSFDLRRELPERKWAHGVH